MAGFSLGLLKRLVITGGHGDLAKVVAAAFVGPDWTIDAPGSEELDVTRKDSVTSYFEDRPTDLLVCCAGLIMDGPLARMPELDWDRVVRVNYEGAAAAARAVLPGMTRRGEGHVVFISSNSAIHPPSGQAAYTAAKAALIGLNSFLATTHGPSNIRVNTLLPGFMETKMTSAVTPRRRGEILGEHCLGRFNTTEAVAGFIHYLHHSLPHTSGQVFRLDNRV